MIRRLLVSLLFSFGSGASSLAQNPADVFTDEQRKALDSIAKAAKKNGVGPRGAGQLAGNSESLCVIDEVGLKCWDRTGPIARQSLPTLKHPTYLWAGSGSHCAKEGSDIWCWKWKERKYRKFPEFKDAEQVSVSTNFVCGSQEEKTVCVSHDDEETRKVVPLAASLPESSGKKRLEGAIAGERFVCGVYKTDRPFDWSRQTLLCTGNILQGMAEKTPFLGSPQADRIATDSFLVCFASHLTNRLECQDLRQSVPKPDGSGLFSAGRQYQGDLDLYMAGDTLLTGSHTVCVSDRETKVDPSGLFSKTQSRVHCGPATTICPLDQNAARAGLDRRIIPLTPVPLLDGASVVTPFLDGICGLKKDGVKCWSVAKQEEIRIFDNFRTLPTLEFRVETLAETLKTVSDYTYREKSVLLRRFASVVDTLPPAVTGTLSAGLYARVFMMNVVSPLLESASTPLFERDVLKIFRADLKEYNTFLKINSFDDFHRWPSARPLGLACLVGSLSSSQSFNGSDSDRKALAELIADISMSLQRDTYQRDWETLKKKIAGTRKHWEALALSPKTRGAGLVTHLLTQFLLAP